MDNRYEIAEQNGMSREFADWFFDNKKAGCENAWLMMMAAMWEGWKGRAAILKSFGNSEQLDEVGSWNNHRNTPTAHDGNHTEQNLDMVDHFGDATKKVMLHGSEPETDNTNKQFESLGRGDK